MSEIQARTFETIYQIAPEAAVKRLQGFRERVPARNIEIGKNIYPVWNIGEGERAAVFLPSGMGHGEVWFPYLTAIAPEIRVVALSLAVNKTIEGYCRDLHALFERLGLKKVVLIAQAIGGLIAQSYVRLYPNEVEGMALCMCGAPAQGLPKGIQQKWVERKKLASKLFFAPFKVMRQRMAYQTFHGMCPPELEDALSFWRAFIAETYEYAVYKKQYIALNCRAVPGIYARLPYAPGDLNGWKGKTLLLEAENDQYYPDEEKALLRALYPHAQLATLGKGGQLALLAEEREGSRILLDFLRGLREGEGA
ncbi:MAG: alpha/beta hydrolase [Christensenellaceae bacterium]|jgi:pimeloyl-ACP methyl ester carboxylesterase|nr:alpha/beta hydrolase [Christensenellaceae bacterium]